MLVVMVVVGVVVVVVVVVVLLLLMMMMMMMIMIMMMMLLFGSTWDLSLRCTSMLLGRTQKQQTATTVFNHLPVCEPSFASLQLAEASPP